MGNLHDEELCREIQLLGCLLAASATRLSPLTLREIDSALAVRHSTVCHDFHAGDQPQGGGPRICQGAGPATSLCPRPPCCERGWAW